MVLNGCERFSVVMSIYKCRKTRKNEMKINIKLKEGDLIGMKNEKNESRVNEKWKNYVKNRVEEEKRKNYLKKKHKNSNCFENRMVKNVIIKIYNLEKTKKN